MAHTERQIVEHLVRDHRLRIRYSTYMLMPAGNDGIAIKHKTCGMVSHNPHDVENRYCGHCHLFLSDV